MAALWLLAVAAGGCSSTDTTYYGPPGGLTGKKLPSPKDTGSSGGSGGSSASGSGGNGSSGAGSGGSSSSGGGRSSGSGGADAGDGGLAGCAVSWATQIFPNMSATGQWKCADATSCHGGLQGPKMTSDPNATYRALAAYTMQFAPQKVPYVLPGSTDPTKSGIVCNLSGTACGTQMPLQGIVTGTAALTAQEVTALNTWVACGSPEN